MIGHLGHKVSPLLDGQLPPAEAERLWAHVHTCPGCRALVEHEGWVKTRLAGLALSGPQPSAPGHLHGMLCDPMAAARLRPDPVEHPDRHPGRRRAVAAAAVLSAGSVGAAVVGVLALALPAGSPVLDRRGPTTSLIRPSDPPRTVSDRVSVGPTAPAAQVNLRGSATPSGSTRLGASIQQWETIAP